MLVKRMTPVIQNWRRSDAAQVGNRSGSNGQNKQTWAMSEGMRELRDRQLGTE